MHCSPLTTRTTQRCDASAFSAAQVHASSQPAIHPCIHPFYGTQLSCQQQHSACRVGICSPMCMSCSMQLKAEGWAGLQMCATRTWGSLPGRRRMQWWLLWLLQELRCTGRAWAPRLPPSAGAGSLARSLLWYPCLHLCRLTVLAARLRGRLCLSHPLQSLVIPGHYWSCVACITVC